MNEQNRISLREYVEALFREKERALDMAAAERDRAAEVLRDEQRRALLVAEAEREKAAAALRAGTDRAIADNYARLREQLSASEELLKSMVAANSRTLTAAIDSAEKAVSKAEESQQRVNVGQNEFRQQLKDQNAATERTMLPRREYEVQHASLTQGLATLREEVAELRTQVAVGPPGLRTLQSVSDASTGEQHGRRLVVDNTFRVLGVVIAVLTLVLLVAVQTHGFTK